MRIVPVLLTALASAALGSCGASSSSPEPPVVSRASPASFDGIYQGSVKTTAVAAGGNAGWCQTTASTTLAVSAGRFSLSLPHPNVPGNPTPTFVASIAPDGSFQTQGQDGTSSFSGQLSGPRLEGVVNGSGCQYAIAATKS